MSAPGRGFIRILVEDVEAALRRNIAENTDRHRREAIRSIFAAIEGLGFIYREHIRGIATDVSTLDIATDIALQEKSFSIGSRGEVIETHRFTPLGTMLRLVTKVAERACGAKPIDFSDVGYSQLKIAVGVRNRLTHPKAKADLDVSTDDLAIAERGFLWLLRVVTESMAQANVRLVSFNNEAAELADALMKGDETALADYRQAASQLES